MQYVWDRNGGRLWEETNYIFPDVHKARNAHTELKARHALLLQALNKSDHVDPKSLRGIVEGNESALQEMQSFFDTCLHRAHTSQWPSTASAVKASQVLAIPELCEKILLFLWPRDVLDAVQINKGTLSVFEGSAKLKNRLILRCAENGFLYSAFREMLSSKPEAEHDIDDDDVDQNDWTDFEKFRVTFTTLAGSTDTVSNGTVAKQPSRVAIEAWFGAFRDLPRIGSRCRSMLICQPIVRVMQVTLSCCPNGGRLTQAPRRWAATCSRPNTHNTYGESEEDQHLEEEDIANNDVTQSLEIKNATGITVGDVHAATVKLRRAHAHCLNATLKVHDEEGSICPDIRFHSDVTPNSDDPYLIAEADAQVAQVTQNAKNAADNLRLDMYILEKKKAWDKGWNLPTFENFKEKYQKQLQKSGQ